MHLVQRGARGTDIVRDAHDSARFAPSLLYLNDTYSDPNWGRYAVGPTRLARPSHWPERDPLVHILAWTLLTNHFHLLVQEVRDGGTAKFMQRIGGSMSMRFNMKYREKGSLFQGSYHARTVTEDEHYHYLTFYILVKNVLDMYPGGLHAARDNFDDAWEWAKRYPYSSLGDVLLGRVSPITDDKEGLIASIIGPGDSYKKEARELLDLHMTSHSEEFQNFMLEPWE